jgi:myo-inositol-1(or 4)-monophosphatase
MYKKELKIAKQAAKQAGLEIKKEFLNWKRGQAKFKEPKQIVTWVDKKSEKKLFSYLKKNFPNYGMISEESKPLHKKSDYSWIIDPLDGTTNFTTHHPFFAVSIALSYKKEIVLAVTYDIILNEMYWAVQGQGAYRDNNKLSVSKRTSFKKAVVSYTHGSDMAATKKAFKIYTHFHIKAQKCRNFACTSLQMANTAAGNDEIFISFGHKLWDVAAGALLIKEAGGIVSNNKNKIWNKNSKNIVCSNKALHPIIIKELKKLKLA